MSIDWAVFSALTLFCAIWGYHKGALRVALRIVCFISGYVSAWKFTPLLAQWLIANHKLEGVIVYPAAGFTLFFATSITLNILCALLLWLLPTSIKESGKPIGALLGSSVGILMGALLVWTIGVVHDSWEQRQGITTHTPPSVIHKLAGDMIAKASTILMGDASIAKTTAQLLRDPASITQGIGHLAKQPELRTLFTDPISHNILLTGDTAQIMQQPSFKKLVADSETMKLLDQSGLGGDTPEEKQKALAENFSTYAKNAQRFKDTEEYKAVINDPDIVSKIQQGNYLPLLTNEKVRHLTDLLSQKNTSPQETVTVTGNASSPPVSQKIYRWKDKNGQLHFSSDKPKEKDVIGAIDIVAQ